MRLAKKHRYIMYIMLNVAKRSEGMGLKIMKFHAIVHMVEDILLYGVPMLFDTGSNESHHKPMKYAARLTQRNEATFNYQTAKRVTEFLVLDLAIKEVEGGGVNWEYFDLDAEMEPGSADEDAESSIEEDLVTDTEAMNVSMEATDADTVGSDPDPVESGEDSTDSGLVIVTGGTRIPVFEAAKVVAAKTISSYTVSPSCPRCRRTIGNLSRLPK